MTTDLLRFMDNKGHSAIMNEITRSLNRFGLNPDFEAIYTIIQAMTNPKQSIHASGPLTAYLCKELLIEIPQQQCQDLLKAFKEFLYKACQPNPSMLPKIGETYSKFFDILGRYHSIKDEEFVYSSYSPFKKPTETIITTNYDMILEQYFWNEGVPFVDGFKKTTEQPQIGKLDFKEFSENHVLSAINILVKLHGSVWNYKDGHKIFKTSVDPKSCPIPINIEENMMIFPVNDKPILRYPYYDFYDFFRKRPWEKLIVVGYSFRDAPVNYAIHDHLMKVNDSRIILIDPNPEMAIKNFTDDFSENLKDRITPIKGEFGKSETFTELQQVLKSLGK